MKIFRIITCLLLFTLSQQIGQAQQPTVTEPTEKSAEGFIELGMPLEEALTKITFMYPSLKSGNLIGAIVFEGEGVTREKDYIQLRKPIKRWWAGEEREGKGGAGLSITNMGDGIIGTIDKLGNVTGSMP